MMVDKTTRILHRSIALAWTMIALALLQVGWWSINRSPPFELLSVSTSATVAGEYILIDAKVRRDPSRNCDVKYMRYITDAAGYRTELGGLQYMTDEAIDALEKETPGELHLAIRIPENVVSGNAVIGTVLSYACNPVQQVFPIQELINIPVRIL